MYKMTIIHTEYNTCLLFFRPPCGKMRTKKPQIIKKGTHAPPVFLPAALCKGKNMKVTWFGTASIGLESGDTKILFDPFLRLNDKLTPLTPADFSGYDAILITHGHVDHLLDVPRILRADTNVEVYCTAAPRKTLLKAGVEDRRINLIAPGDLLNFGPFKIHVRHGKHVMFDPAYIGASFPNCLKNVPKALWLVSTGVTMPESSEIVIYEIEAEGKTAMLMGSYGTDSSVSYAKEPDIWFFPYNGSTRIPRLAAEKIRELRPKTIFFDHFDDAFPPLTRRMDVEGYAKTLQKEYPHIRTIIPREKHPVIL